MLEFQRKKSKDSVMLLICRTRVPYHLLGNKGNGKNGSKGSKNGSKEQNGSKGSGLGQASLIVSDSNDQHPQCC